MSEPRIYIVISTFFPSVGGAENQALLQSSSLRKSGYEATVVTFRHSREWLPREVVGGVPVLRVAGMLLIDRWKRPRLLQKLLFLMAILVLGWTLWQQRRNYDILHVYNLGVPALIAALICRLSGKALIIAIRSAGSSTVSGAGPSLHVGSLDASAAWLRVDERLRANGQVRVSSDLEALARMGKPVMRLARFLLSSTHAVIVVLSSRMKKSLLAYDFTLPDIQLIPNGVDINRFKPDPEAAALSEREQVVVCISGLRYEKGIDVLLQAWSLVHQQAPQARLIIVGRGTLEDQLKHMAQALGLTDCVEFTGIQSDIPAQLHRGSIMVLPSRWEGMPNAVLEAMACGLPCVATRVSGSEDIIQHGVNGLLVEVEDHQGMAQALLALLREPPLVQKYGRAARATVERHYSLEQVMLSYKELYARVTGRSEEYTSVLPPSKIYQQSS